MQGRIVKGIAGFYYVYVDGRGVFECKAKGAFRKQGLKPMVGDQVEMEVTRAKAFEGNITEIYERRSELIRPAVANVDQALVIFAACHPEPNFNLLDRFLVMMEEKQIKTIILFNKRDLIGPKEEEMIRQIYAASGYPIYFISAKEEQGLEAVRQLLLGKVSTVAGPSGVGKSSLINRLRGSQYMQTGAISHKLGRGKHTTRHSELIPLEAEAAGEDLSYEGAKGFIMDTPGFSSLFVPDFEKEELAYFFPEFTSYSPDCKFQPCSHIHEPHCGVQQALAEGAISRSRYESYCQIYEEMASRRRY